MEIISLKTFNFLGGLYKIARSILFLSVVHARRPFRRDKGTDIFFSDKLCQDETGQYYGNVLHTSNLFL